MKVISIAAHNTISSLGDSPDLVWKSYLDDVHYLSLKSFEESECFLGELSENLEEDIRALRKSKKKYQDLDKSVLMAIYTSRKAVRASNWKSEDVFGINIGSSRGATRLFEKYHGEFKDNSKTNPLTSPTTTLGNLSSWVANDLRSLGPAISHSITCSTGLHAVLNGIAWIKSGMSDKFLVGATEAANTLFTIAQMQALKIYTRDTEKVYPSRPLDFSKTRNTMCLSEASGVFCLEKREKQDVAIYIESVGFATEEVVHNTSISDNADCFQNSMKMALKNASLDLVDAIIMHAPGTIKGDLSEFEAIKIVFGKDRMPAITSNKWKVGHSLGTSGILSLELALLILKHQKFIKIPYLENQKEPEQLESIMINAVGFGGNAVSVILRKNKS